uniref:UBA domain-containing protein n=1 Tax=Calcidiscus leptoporus TaxID=127549 RepID=A0A7S0NWI6_9EUKA
MECCEGRWLTISDNYALLLLDAVWATLLLHSCDGSLAQLSKQREASARMDKARSLLQALHGPDWQRLAMREDTGAQRAIYCRLFVLQGALAYHRGDLHDARSLLNRSEGLRRELTLTADDDEKVAQLLSMGFDSRTARAALLACGKDVLRAAACIVEKRDAALRLRRSDQLRREQQRELVAFGTTAAGHHVALDALNSLVSLGYPRPLAAEALRRCENNMDASLTQLTSEEAQVALDTLACASPASARASSCVAAP